MLQKAAEKESILLDNEGEETSNTSKKLDVEGTKDSQKESRELTEAEKTKILQQKETERKQMIKHYGREAEIYEAQNRVIEAKLKYMQNMMQHRMVSKDFNETMNTEDNGESSEKG